MNTVTKDAHVATLTDGVWQSATASFALWLNSVAPTVDAAVRYGCTLGDDAPTMSVFVDEPPSITHS